MTPKLTGRKLAYMSSFRPINIGSEERFVRATQYFSHLPEPADEAEAVAAAFCVIPDSIASTSASLPAGPRAALP
jgi:penicillin V acylase-like amidase (Ntn superfamily)